MSIGLEETNTLLLIS